MRRSRCRTLGLTLLIVGSWTFAVGPDSASHVGPGAAPVVAQSPGGIADGVRLPQQIPVAAREAEWEFVLQLEQLGYEGSLEPVETAAPIAEGNRVEYRRGALTEWYVNRPDGLEQGFTLVEAPPGGSATSTPKEPARLALQRTSSNAIKGAPATGVRSPSSTPPNLRRWTISAPRWLFRTTPRSSAPTGRPTS